jgi:saccharopine dehydrogenase (NAD+, L-lysine-forming)
MTIKIWLRAETKPHEERTALTPDTTRVLIESGHEVTVERSGQSAIPMQAFADVGCRIAEPGSWSQAPSDAYILGLKELPESDSALGHRHIYFAHAYKEQRGWQDVLGRFARGGGKLLDIEFLLDENARRVVAFGFWAGFAGAAVAIKNWCGQQSGAQPVVPPLHSYESRDALIDDLRAELKAATAGGSKLPTVIVIGAAGRVGSGAAALAEALDLSLTGWDMAETARGGPFEEVLAHDIFINCVLVHEPLPPFVTRELLEKPQRQLSVISDVSCDPYGDYNPLPIYNECTTFRQPTLRLIEAPRPLDIIAIDHLPSMLPVEASEDFSRQLLPHLLQLDDASNSVWSGAIDIFNAKINLL